MVYKEIQVVYNNILLCIFTINIICAIHENSSSTHLPHFHFRLFIPKVRIHIHGRRHFRVPHQILQRLRIHSCSGHIGTVGMPAHMRRNPRHLHRMCTIILPYHMIKILLPMPRHFRHSILIQEQKSNFVINHRFHFWSSSRLQYALKAFIHSLCHWKVSNPTICLCLCNHILHIR